MVNLQGLKRVGCENLRYSLPNFKVNIVIVLRIASDPRGHYVDSTSSLFKNKVKLTEIDYKINRGFNLL